MRKCFHLELVWRSVLQGWQAPPISIHAYRPQHFLKTRLQLGPGFLLCALTWGPLNLGDHRAYLVITRKETESGKVRAWYRLAVLGSHPPGTLGLIGYPTSLAWVSVSPSAKWVCASPPRGRGANLDHACLERSKLGTQWPSSKQRSIPPPRSGLPPWLQDEAWEDGRPEEKSPAFTGAFQPESLSCSLVQDKICWVIKHRDPQTVAGR